MKKIAIVVGTRPEIIKMAPIIKQLKNFYILHSGQHYSYELDKIFFKQLKLPKPRYQLEVGSMAPAQQTALIITRAADVFCKDRPDLVLVQGDTNTVLAATLAAKKNDILIGHVEAGLRSYDRQMPEETNRVLTDHCSDYLFAPTRTSKNILLAENIKKSRIFMTGNTIVDAVLQNIKLAKKQKLKQKFILLSLHRQENVDNPQRFASIIKGVEAISRQHGIQIIYPIHPRSEKMAKKHDISLNRLTVIKPVDYITFLNLEKNARIIMTDSGGVQEEACILQTPCVTLRNNTERPETVKVGANVVAGVTSKNIVKCANNMLDSKKSWRNPFGKGDAAKRIIEIINKN